VSKSLELLVRGRNKVLLIVLLLAHLCFIHTFLIRFTLLPRYLLIRLLALLQIQLTWPYGRPRFGDRDSTGNLLSHFRSRMNPQILLLDFLFPLADHLFLLLDLKSLFREFALVLVEEQLFLRQLGFNVLYLLLFLVQIFLTVYFDLVLQHHLL
jgi:hypothetical protein